MDGLDELTMVVANNFPIAPNTNESYGPALVFLLLSSMFFNCSKIVYCRIGFATSTSAGSTPANNELKPSSFSIFMSVPIVLGRLTILASPPAFSTSVSAASRLRAVMRVFTTQMGLVQNTVAEPASAPAAIDSSVVRRLLRRP